MRARRAAKVVAVLALGAMLAVACSSDDDGGSTDAGDTTTTAAETTGTTSSGPCTVTVGVSATDAGKMLGADLGDPNFRETYGGGDPTRVETNLLYSEILRQVNEDGGFGGCQIKPVFSYLKVPADDPAAEQEKGCRELTEDNDVDVSVQVEFAFYDDLVKCLLDRGVPVIEAPQSAVSNSFDSGSDANVFLPYDPFIERWGPMVDELAAAGYLGPKADRGDVTVGILARDAPVDRKLAEKVWKPKLEAQGVDEVVVETFALGRDVTVGAINSAVLKMKSAGVTHVMFGPGPIINLFMNTAETQDYRPRYALTSRNNPFYMVNLAPADQFKDAMLVGWSMWHDGVPEAEQPANPALAACRGIYPKGKDIAGQDQTTYAWCSAIDFLAEVGKHVTEISPEGIAKGVEATTAGYESAMTYEGKTSFGPKKHDGVDFIRILEFDSAAKRFKLTDRPAKKLP